MTAPVLQAAARDILRLIRQMAGLLRDGERNHEKYIGLGINDGGLHRGYRRLCVG